MGTGSKPTRYVRFIIVCRFDSLNILTYYNKNFKMFKNKVYNLQFVHISATLLIYFFVCGKMISAKNEVIL